MALIFRFKKKIMNLFESIRDEMKYQKILFFCGPFIGGEAHQTFQNTWITWESLVRVVGRGEVGLSGYRSNIYACKTSLV